MNRKVLSLILIVVLATAFVSCSSMPGTDKGKDLDGEWVYTDGEDYNESISIDGESALLELWVGTAYKGIVDTKNSTITFEDFNQSKSYPAVFDYEVINDKLVLTMDSEKNNGDVFRTIVFNRVSKDK